MWSDVDGETKIDFWEFWFMFNRQVILPSDNSDNLGYDI